MDAWISQYGPFGAGVVLTLYVVRMFAGDAVRVWDKFRAARTGNGVEYRERYKSEPRRVAEAQTRLAEAVRSIQREVSDHAERDLKQHADLAVTLTNLASATTALVGEVRRLSDDIRENSRQMVELRVGRANNQD